MKERSTLWIHSQIKACMDAADCQPDYCLDLFEPSGKNAALLEWLTGFKYLLKLYQENVLLLTGHGRRRRSLPDAITNSTTAPLVADNSSTPFTRFKENLEYTVVMPGELFHRPALEATCATSMMVAVALGALLFMSALLVSLSHRLLDTISSTRGIQDLLSFPFLC